MKETKKVYIYKFSGEWMGPSCGRLSFNITWLTNTGKMKQEKYIKVWKLLCFSL